MFLYENKKRHVSCLLVSLKKKKEKKERKTEKET